MERCEGWTGMDFIVFFYEVIYNDCLFNFSWNIMSKSVEDYA